MSEGYNLKRLISEYEIEIEGKLLLYPDKVVFEPKDEDAERVEIPTKKIKDARFATKEDISALRVWLAGPVLGAFFKKEHKILLIDFENEGIIEHLTLEGKDADLAMETLRDIRKARSPR